MLYTFNNEQWALWSLRILGGATLKSKSKATGKLRRVWRRTLVWTYRNVPMGLRTMAGLLLVVGGVFGFLPVLGFWMIPLGFAVIALDLKVLMKHWRRGHRKGPKSQRREGIDSTSSDEE